MINNKFFIYSSFDIYLYRMILFSNVYLLSQIFVDNTCNFNIDILTMNKMNELKTFFLGFIGVTIFKNFLRIFMKYSLRNIKFNNF